MSCEQYREDLIGVLESTATPEAAEAVRKHLDTCEACCAEMEQYRAIRARLEASAAASLLRCGRRC
jgi:anti-sigma factor RsiW